MMKAYYHLIKGSNDNDNMALSCHVIEFSGSPPDVPPSPQGSIGYTEKPLAPLLEDLTVRLASCFIRCVLNYAQHRDTTKPVVQFRDERLAYRHGTLQRKLKIEAIDDGGLRLLEKDGCVHVAMLEAKRTFQTIVDGAPTVSDRFRQGSGPDGWRGSSIAVRLQAFCRLK